MYCPSKIKMLLVLLNWSFCTLFFLEMLSVLFPGRGKIRTISQFGLRVFVLTALGSDRETGEVQTEVEDVLSWEVPQVC